MIELEYKNYNQTSGSMFYLLPLLVVFIVMQTRIN